jgi:hypothetical protein
VRRRDAGSATMRVITLPIGDSLSASWLEPP